MSSLVTEIQRNTFYCLEGQFSSFLNQEKRSSGERLPYVCLEQPFPTIIENESVPPPIQRKIRVLYETAEKKPAITLFFVPNDENRTAFFYGEKDSFLIGNRKKFHAAYRTDSSSDNAIRIGLSWEVTKKKPPSAEDRLSMVNEIRINEALHKEPHTNLQEKQEIFHILLNPPQESPLMQVIISSYYPKGDLWSCLKKEKDLPEMHITKARIEGLQAGVDHLHRLGVCHRDIKPENILVGPEAEIKITDFGFATREDDPWLGLRLGTAGCRSPEIALLDQDNSAKEAQNNRADFFKKLKESDRWGTTLSVYYLLHRKYPYSVPRSPEGKIGLEEEKKYIEQEQAKGFFESYPEPGDPSSYKHALWECLHINSLKRRPELPPLTEEAYASFIPQPSSKERAGQKHPLSS